MIPESTQRYALSNGATTIYLREIEEGYTSTIEMPFNKVNKENGQVAIFDDGSSYDKYTCKFSIVLDASAMATLLTWYSDFPTNDYTILNFPSSPSATARGFSPFTPAYGDEGIFYFNILSVNQTGTLDNERYQWFRVELLMASTLNKPTYSPSLGNNEGNLQIGTIGGLRYPIGGYQPNVVYDSNGVTLSNDNNFINTMGWQSDKTKMTLNLLFDKMSLLIKHLLSERTNDISILVPSGHYPYGASQGDNKAFNSRLISDKLVVKHMGAKRYQIELEFQRVI